MRSYSAIPRLTPWIRYFLAIFLSLWIANTPICFGEDSAPLAYDLDRSWEIDSGDFLKAIHFMKDGAIPLTLDEEPGMDWKDLFLLSNRWGARADFVPGEVPADPEKVAPPCDDTVPGDIFDDTDFIYSGTDPIQIWVEPETFDATRVAVLRGRVMVRDGTYEPGVEITILDHPEYGKTLSRGDGMFDMAVNGGELFTVNYRKEGFFPVQRQVRAPWRDYVWLPEVALVPLDPIVTTVDFSEPIQVAQGSLVSDDDGSRRANVLLSQGTIAEMVLPSGATQALDRLDIRITEYTVGENGPDAMPAVLPPTSGYTYCVEISADQALAAGASEVRFSTPIYQYVEDFIGFPVGSIVPSGYYDRKKGEWVASKDGLVIEILNITGGMVEIDVAGQGVAATPETLATYGITDVEREKLASLYPNPPVQLWRVPIYHLTPYDFNWPVDPPEDATNPNQPPPEYEDPEDDFCEGEGSVIEIQNRILGESVPIIGTPYTLNYRNDRVPGRSSGRTLEIPLSGDSIPDSLSRIRLEIEVAGQKTVLNFAPQTDLAYSYVWDGRDAYGRMLLGKQRIRVKIAYVYRTEYQIWECPQINPAFYSFARYSCKRNRTIPSRLAVEWDYIQLWDGEIGAWNFSKYGLGGWTFDVHHAYDHAGKTVYRGSGRRRKARNSTNVISTIAGTGTRDSDHPDYGNGFPATEASFYQIRDLEVGPDGLLYIADAGHNQIRRIGADGIITRVVGTQKRGYNGDGIPANEAHLFSPQDIAFGPDGSMYIADEANSRIRRVDLEGIIWTVAGNGEVGSYIYPEGDGGPATEAALYTPHGIAVAPDGTLYLSEMGANRIRYVSPDGIITSLPLDIEIRAPRQMEVGPDGGLYFPQVSGSPSGSQIYRLTPDGELTKLAGSCYQVGADWICSGYGGDGGPAVDAMISANGYIALGAEGSIYFSDASRIRRIDPEGIINTVVGTGDHDFGGDGLPATRAQLYSPTGLALAPDGTLYIADDKNYRIRRIGPTLPGYSYGNIMIRSEDGAEIYLFDDAGRHLSTTSAYTGALLHAFEYNSEGRLIRIVDGDGNATHIERDVDGNPLRVVGLYGQRTDLSLDVNGYLETLINPAGEAASFVYSEGGLLEEKTDPRGYTWRYVYDSEGNLTRHEDPAGGFETLEQTILENGYQITRTTALGRTRSFQAIYSPTGEMRMRNVFGCCGVNEVYVRNDGYVVTTYPNGTVQTALSNADPRSGMQAPYTSSLKVKTPSGLTSTTTLKREVDQANPDDLMSPFLQTDIITKNGKAYTIIFDSTRNLRRVISPMGRETMTWLDSQGRVRETQASGLAPTTYDYDSQGRLSAITQGSEENARTSSIGYDSDGNIASLIDAASRAGSLEYDLTGRPTRQILPDGQAIEYEYDLNGNITSIAPPGRPSHRFEYSSLNQEIAYTAPRVGEASGTTRHLFNQDQQMTRLSRPDGAVIDLSYSTEGKIDSLTTPQGAIHYIYDASSGNPLSIITAQDQILNFEHDGFLLTHSAWQGDVSGTLDFIYNRDFRLSSMAIENGTPIEYFYDDDGLLVQAGSLAIVRDASHGLVASTHLGKVTDTYSWNGFEELTDYSAKVDGSEVFRAGYSWDKVGQLTRKEEMIEGETHVYDYRYDEGGRLAVVLVDQATRAVYTYDANGNRLTFAGESGVLSAAYDDQDRLTRYGDREYEYTANGELRCATAGGDPTCYEYNTLGHLTAVDLPGGTSMEYILDGLHRRVGKKMNGVLTQAFLYKDSLCPVAELDGNGVVAAEYIYGTRYHIPNVMKKAGKTYRMISDHLGSPRLIIDVESGEVAQRMDYDEFGNIIHDTNPGFQPFGFAGGIYDDRTNLTQFGLRDYDSATGRWTTKDPILFEGAGPNLYAYVMNNPQNRIDPGGTRCNSTVTEAYLQGLRQILALRSEAARHERGIHAMGVMLGDIQPTMGEEAVGLAETTVEFLNSLMDALRGGYTMGDGARNAAENLRQQEDLRRGIARARRRLAEIELEIMAIEQSLALARQMCPCLYEVEFP